MSAPLTTRVPPRSALTVVIVFVILLSALAVVVRGADEGAGSAAGDPGVNYVIRRGDVLSFAVLAEPDLRRELRIEADGSIILPLVGRVVADGRTVEQLNAEITALYDRDYLVNPQITLQVVGYARQGVQILGQVNRPGNVGFPDEKPLSLLEAIGAAGGFTRRANTGKVTIRRTAAAGGQRLIEIDVGKLLSDPSKNDLQLLDGDTVLVGERWI